MRIREARGKTTHNSVRFAHTLLRAAVNFIRWLSQDGKTLSGLEQEVVDRWFARTSGSKYLVLPFLRWAERRKLFRTKLSMPKPASPEIGVVNTTAQFDPDSNDTARIDLTIQVALLMNHFYGEHLSRIVQLCTLDLYFDDDKQAFIRRKRARMLKLRAPLSDLVRRLDVLARENPKARRPDGAHWLFPGQSYGTHLSVSRLERAFAKLGVSARSERNVALAHFASISPAPVISALLGIHAGTAVRWSEQFGSNYGDFVSRRKKAIDARC